jgi:hypothetical protein
VQAAVSSEQSDELDRWFEEQATSVANMPAAQKLPAGSASLDIETAAADVHRARHVPALGLRRSRARENGERQAECRCLECRPLRSSVHDCCAPRWAASRLRAGVAASRVE